MIDINELINNPSLFENIKESDIPDLSEQIIPMFQEKISNTADYLTNKLMAEPDKSSKEAFEYRVKDAIKNAVYSYVAHEKWKINIPISPYIAKSMFMFAKVLIDQNESGLDKIKIYICPACKERKSKEFLEKDNDMLYCKTCDINSSDPSLDNEHRLLYRAFSKHSTKGVKCPKCSKFVPNSLKNDNILNCPYPGCHADCLSAEEIKHPASVINRSFVSINNIIKSNNSNGETGSFKPKEFSEQYCDSKSNACDVLVNEQEFSNKFETIKDIIEMQKKAHGYARKLPTKASMYEAFANVLQAYPQDMINYLTIGGQNSDISIQATIYQEFAKIMQSKLPIKMYLKGNLIYIDNPLDERLHLFSGIREFVNFIDHNSIIKKRKGSVCSGNDKIEDVNDSFIGQIISVTDINGDNLTSFVDYYNFTSIRFKFNEKVKPGTDVIVKYYSILPNYTLGSMIHLQRIKKKISDSVNRKY